MIIYDQHLLSKVCHLITINVIPIVIICVKNYILSLDTSVEKIAREIFLILILTL